MKFKVKPLFLTKEEIEVMKRTPKILKKISPSNRILPYIMSREGLSNNLRRKNGFTMKPHPLVPHAWEQHEEAEPCISRVFSRLSSFENARIIGMVLQN